jgi:hypothetical protein
VALTALTDGSGDTYVPVFADSSDLQDRTYDLGEFCPFGVNMPNDGPNPHSYQDKVAELIGKGVRGIRYEVQWGIVETAPGVYSWNAYSINSDITYLRNNGCTIAIEAGYTPGHRTGNRYRVYPPINSVDTPQDVTFVNGQATLPNAPIFIEDRNGERPGPCLIDSAATKSSVSQQLLSWALVDENNNRQTRTSSQGFADRYCAYTGSWPIDLSTLVVEVETGAGTNVWETWTRVQRLDSNSTGKVYYADYTGRITFKDSRMLCNATAPQPGARVRASYQYYTVVYQRPVEYTVEKLTGVLTKGAAGFSVPEMANDFSSGFGPSWTWYQDDLGPVPGERVYDGFPGPDLEQIWSFTGTQPSYTVDGKLNITMPASGASELQFHTSASYYSDWLVTVDMSNVTTVSGSEVGLVVRMDATNYIRAFMNHNGQLTLQKVEGGVWTSQTLGWTWSKNRRIFLRKTGNTFQAWVSGLEDNQSYLTASYANQFLTDLVGMWIKSGASGSTLVSFDDFYFRGPWELPVMSVSGGAVTAAIWSGLRAMYLQPVTNGTANFTISLKTSMPATTGANRAAVGIVLWQNADNYVKALQISDGGANRKLLVVARQNGSDVHNLMDGFNEVQDVTLTVTRVGDSFTVTMRPKTPYATDRTFSMPGFAPVYAGIAFEHQPQRNHMTVTVDDWSVTGGGAGIPDNCKVMYHYVDLPAVQAFGAALAQQFGDRVMHFEYGNEVHNAPWWTWTGGLDLYAKCLEAFSAGVKSVLPQAKVLNAGWPDDHSIVSLHSNLYQWISKSVFDIAAWHPYWFSRNAPGTSFDNHLQQMITELQQGNDNDKPIFAGEFSTQCGMLAATNQVTTDGPNERRQAEYAFQALCKMFRTGRYEAVQWWPGTDRHEHPVNEWLMHGAHDGLFNNTPGQTGVPLMAKPVLHMIKELALAPGIIIDLVTYSGNTPVPSSRKHTLGSLSLIVRRAENLQTVTVQGSKTGWPQDATISRVCVGRVETSQVTYATVNTSSPNLVAEEVTMTWEPQRYEWLITSNVRGSLGVAQPEEFWTAPGNTWSMTMPPDPNEAVEPVQWVMEIPKGDGWAGVGQWANTGQSGETVITIPLNGEARYLRVLYTLSGPIELAEVQVRDSAMSIISTGKLYYFDGWRGKYRARWLAP